MDAVTPYGTVVGGIHQFVVSSVSPSLQQISAVTFPNRPAITTVTLTSAAPGEAWQAVPNANWISLNQTNGVTPATIQVTLDPSSTAPLTRTGAIAINGASGMLFTIPVQLTVESLALTIIKSDPASAKVYAISEDQSTTPARAYLLEIDTATESIERVVSVGASVTDLAIHRGDQRIYVPNWQTGSLLAIDLNTFQLVQSYSFAPSSSGGGDVYRVAAGGPGRVVVEEEDQWIDISLFDTGAGTKLANAFVREGGGAFGGDGRYYYHGDNNSSGAEIHKFDVLGDQFNELAHVRVASVNYYGSRTVVVSEDGSRVFWNGSVFDANLVEQWTIGDEIFATSADGRYAFSQSKVYDTVQRVAVLGMPGSTAVSAFNSISRKLVVQVGAGLGFFEITNPLSLPAPILSVAATNYNSVVVNWTDRSLEDGFTVQRRPAGTVTWTDIATTGRDVTQYTFTGLSPETVYEFRVKADTATVSSPWSAILSVTTPATPPTTPSLSPLVAVVSSVTLAWFNPSFETAIIVERSVGTATNWLVLATLPADTTGYTDTNVVSSTAYNYRVKARNSAGDSAYSIIRSITVPAPQPPAAPATLVARPIANFTVLVAWIDVATETGYRIERRTEDPNSWAVISTLASNTTSYADTNVIGGVEYWYRVQAFNANGSSPYSNQDDAVPLNIVNLIFDDFDPDREPGVWASISGAVATNGGQGFRGSKALYFAASGERSATTIPLDVSTGGSIEFRVRAGNQAIDGNLFWNNSEDGEQVAFEYSKDHGVTWSLIQTLNTVYPSLSGWTAFSLGVPGAAAGPNTQFRWRQSSNSGIAYDCWALDDVVIQGVAPAPPESVPFIISSAGSSTSMAVFWVGAERASSYRVERKVGVQPWAVVATLPVFVTYYTDVGLLPGTAYSYRIMAVNAGGAAPYSPLTTGFTWSQMQQWIADNYGSPEALSSVEMTTPGSDGCPPILRYAYGLNATETLRQLPPGQSSGYPRIWLDQSRNRLRIEFVRRKAALNPGIIYGVEFCGELSEWSAGGTPLSTTSIDSIWERVLYEDTVTTIGAKSRFCRVTVRPSP